MIVLGDTVDPCVHGIHDFSYKVRPPASVVSTDDRCFLFDGSVDSLEHSVACGCPTASGLDLMKRLS